MPHWSLNFTRAKSCNTTIQLYCTKEITDLGMTCKPATISLDKGFNKGMVQSIEPKVIVAQFVANKKKS